jgi:hypothetical protein
VEFTSILPVPTGESLAALPASEALEAIPVHLHFLFPDPSHKEETIEMRPRHSSLWLSLAVLAAASPAAAQTSFITFESGQVRPLALLPDGSRLLAVNTPDNRLEIFDVSAGG